MFTAAKTSAIAAIAALGVAILPAAPALAWGKKEQGFLAGVATAVIVDKLLEANRAARAAPAPTPYYSAPAFVDPKPRYAPAYGTTSTSAIYGTPAARAFNSYSRDERKAIQRQLRYQGYYTGGIDGAFGPGTYGAVTAYARDAGATGNLKSTGGAFAVYDGLLY
ncbi:peptidoglycan-binding domain-containing protein [Xinfangfangia pollutisoli]|uniref:peptidoglycan-binding domain-containing protein n=1 Tax=Xinfangfangia pollutisoli TaxID=2865960 RepID=UPI001CD7DD86|nr:peptidoglycan-binding domain-containing protein [Xinfangfangia pollutisoli]